MKRNPNATLDEVLAEYSSATEGFDAHVLQEFVERYPDFAAALHRYAQVQLSSLRASPDEIAAEPLSIEDLEPLRGTKKLEAISGEQGIRAAAVAVFGACRHGEDMLLILVKDTGIKDAPGWVYDRLAKYVDAPAPVVRRALPLRLHGQHAQRYSAQGKPIEGTALTWAEAVASCISDEETRRILISGEPRT